MAATNVLAFLKESERYVYLFDDASRPALLQVLGRHAADPTLSFTWNDAAILSGHVRRPKTAEVPTWPK
jgi:hypothetical protein